MELTPARSGRVVRLLLLAAVVALAGCDPGRDAVAGEEERRAPVRVDSLFPMEVELERFREGLEPPDGLIGGTGSLEALGDTVIARLARSDTAGLAALTLTRAEFAWLYFPHSMYMAKPYELPPGLVWYRQGNRSSRGLSRLLRRYGGVDLSHARLECPDEGEPLGNAVIRHGCRMAAELAGGEVVRERLFGSVLGLHGSWKLVSFSNGM